MGSAMGVPSKPELPPAQNITISKSDVEGDSFLSQLSDTSLEVLEHFGLEAPALLNQYSCAVEDALIEQVARANKLQEEVKQLQDLIDVVKAVHQVAGFDFNAELERARSQSK